MVLVVGSGGMLPVWARNSTIITTLVCLKIVERWSIVEVELTGEIYEVRLKT
jgi:hypothetical protein